MCRHELWFEAAYRSYYSVLFREFGGFTFDVGSETFLIPRDPLPFIQVPKYGALLAHIFEMQKF